MNDQDKYRRMTGILLFETRLKLRKLRPKQTKSGKIKAWKYIDECAALYKKEMKPIWDAINRFIDEVIIREIRAIVEVFKNK